MGFSPIPISPEGTWGLSLMSNSKVGEIDSHTLNSLAGGNNSNCVHPVRFLKIRLVY